MHKNFYYGLLQVKRSKRKKKMATATTIPVNVVCSAVPTPTPAIPIAPQVLPRRSYMSYRIAFIIFFIVLVIVFTLLAVYVSPWYYIGTGISGLIVLSLLFYSGYRYYY